MGCVSSGQRLRSLRSCVGFTRRMRHGSKRNNRTSWSPTSTTTGIGRSTKPIRWQFRAERRASTMSDEQTILYVGLRRSPLEWSAELEAAADLGVRVHVTSDTDVADTGLPASQL